MTPRAVLRFAPPVLLWIVAVLMLGLFAYAATLRIPLDYNEGWNAYHTAQAMGGGALYDSANPFFSNNYPPLSFYIVGIAGNVVGDYIFAGRIIALASLFAVLWNIFFMARWAGADRPMAALGAGLCGAILCVLAPTYIGMDDPQFLGHALITSGALVLLRRRDDRSAFFATLLIGAGLLTKHNIVALPLALAIWMALHDRRRFMILSAFGLAFAVLSGAILYAIWGEAIVVEMLGHHRVWGSGAELGPKLGDAILLIAPFAALTMLAFAMAPRDPRLRLIAIYLILAFALGFFMETGVGVDQNAIFDGVIAMSVGTAAMSRLWATPRIPRPWFGVLVLVLFGLTVLPRAVGTVIPEEIALIGEGPAWRRVVAEVARSDAPVVCEVLALCYWAEKPAALDVFNYGQKLYTGAVPAGPLDDRLGAKRYRMIVVYEDSLTRPDPPLPPPVMRVMRDNYREMDGIDGEIAVLTPR